MICGYSTDFELIGEERIYLWGNGGLFLVSRTKASIALFILHKKKATCACVRVCEEWEGQYLLTMFYYLFFYVLKEYSEKKKRKQGSEEKILAVVY